jgi:hypothetical protein
LFEIPAIKTYSFASAAEMYEVVKSWDPKEHEGVVVKDANFNRIKVKNPAYMAYNAMRDSLSTSIRSCVEVILLGKEDDIIPMMPEFIAKRIIKFKPVVAKVFKQTEDDYQQFKNIVDMKEFALSVKDKLWPAALFALKRNKTPDLLTFAQGNGKDPLGIPTSSLDSMLELCKKINPKILDLEVEPS